MQYADLQKYFAERSSKSTAKKTPPPSLLETRTAVLEIRRRKGMLIVSGADSPDNDNRSAGSFFKNPVLSEAQFQELTKRAASQGLEIPSYPALRSQPNDAQHKISAAWLVEHSGFSRGYALGPARISSKHALALVNSGDANASDIIALKNEVQRAVREAWGIPLEVEPVFVGF